MEYNLEFSGMNLMIVLGWNLECIWNAKELERKLSEIWNKFDQYLNKTGNYVPGKVF